MTYHGVRCALGFTIPGTITMDSMKMGKEGFIIENPILIRDQIYTRIKREILAGNITSGSQVLEGRMAKQLKVSRTPVREALHALETEGFVESFPRVGYRVREITWAEVMEVYELRAVLEPLGARKAIENRDQTYIDALESAVDKAEAKVKQDPLDAFCEQDAKFDEIILRASGMKLMRDIWTTLRHRLTLYRMQAPDAVGIGARLRSIKGHRRILGFLKARDKQSVAGAIIDHLNDSRKETYQVAFDKREDF